MSTEADRRGLALIVRYGRAVATKSGYWLSGGHRVAQVTVRKLVDSGMVEHPGGDRNQVTPTSVGRRDANPEDLPEDGDRWPDDVVAHVHASVDEDEDDAVWSPPDVRNDRDEPIEVDRVIGGDYE